MPQLTQFLINTSLAIFFMSSAALLNSYLVLMIFWKRRHEKKHEFQLIYARFCVDLTYELVTSVNLNRMFVQAMMSESGDILRSEKFIFAAVWPNFTAGSLKTMLIFLITLERVLAVYFPINYHNYRSKISLRIIFTFIFAFIILENTVIFYYCDFYFFNNPEECENFGCKVVSCFAHQAMLKQEIIYGMILTLTVILSIRLFYWNYTKTEKSATMKRANRLALLDVFTIFTFNILPFTILVNFRFIYGADGAGNDIFVTESIGFVMESLITCNILLWKKNRNKMTNKANVVPKSSKNSWT